MLMPGSGVANQSDGGVVAATKWFVCAPEQPLGPGSQPMGVSCRVHGVIVPLQQVTTTRSHSLELRQPSAVEQ